MSTPTRSVGAGSSAGQFLPPPLARLASLLPLFTRRPPTTDARLRLTMSASSRRSRRTQVTNCPLASLRSRPRRSQPMLALCLTLAASCSDDAGLPRAHPPRSDGSVDANLSDAWPDGGSRDQGRNADLLADLPPVRRDGLPAQTSCGTRICQTATEICARVQRGSSEVQDCISLPTGCETERSCECFDRGDAGAGASYTSPFCYWAGAECGLDVRCTDHLDGNYVRCFCP